MENNENSDAEKKKINEDLVVFMRKRSEHDAPRYVARMKTHAEMERKRRRATAARRNSDHRYHEKTGSAACLKVDSNKSKDKVETEHPGSEDGRMSRRRGVVLGENKKQDGRTRSRSHSPPSDRCGGRRRRKKKCGSRRRRKSCKKRRRRRSCGRRHRRRGKRSCSRRRRRKSCKRRRRKRRGGCCH